MPSLAQTLRLTPAAVKPPVEPEGADRAKTMRRADGREVRKHTIYLAPELSARLTAYCAQSGKNLSAVFAEALTRYLEEDVAPPAPTVREAALGLARALATPLFTMTQKILRGR